MAKVVVKTKIKKVKKKFPVEFIAPAFLNSKTLGMGEITNLADLSSKTIKLNMMYVTGNMKNQHIRLKFRVSEIETKRAKTKLCEYEYIPYYLKRNIKKDITIVEDRFIVISKDNEEIIIKPFLITKTKISALKRKNICFELIEFVETFCKTNSTDEIFAEVLYDKMQLKLKNILKKIVPLKVLEFKKVTVIKK